MPENIEYGITPTFKPEQYVWLKRRLPIDPVSLSEDVMEIATLIQQAGEYTASAIELREASKEDLERILSQAAEKLRTSPTPQGKSRSETAIQSQLYLSPEVAQGKDALGKARLDAALWSTLVEALRAKNGAIRVVADLLNSGFISSSSIMSKRRTEIRNVSQ